MNRWPAQPCVYEINTAVWLQDLSRRNGKRITLGSVPDNELKRLAALRFDAVWLMGVWERSPAARAIGRSEEPLLQAYRAALPDFQVEDVIGSPYAVRSYTVDPMFGGDAELAAIRRRMDKLGLRLILDFVPNHVAVDHDWVTQHPEYLVQGNAEGKQNDPGTWFEAGGSIFAHGRDPYFPAWTDTVQIDYRRPETRRAMTDVLAAVAERCDGVRCDMAMLLVRHVFCRTWGGQFEPAGAEFWPDAIRELKQSRPDFAIAAEVYWDLEYELQQQGFDYTYDKRLYDRLSGHTAEEVRQHLAAGIDYQRQLVRFLENHDEPRAAEVFGIDRQKAAGALALTLPGPHLIHDGQMEGFRIHVPVQLGRRAGEPVNQELASFYSQLTLALALAPFHDGEWRLLECREAWAGNGSERNFVAHRWAQGSQMMLVAANLSPERAQCYIPLEFPPLAGANWELRDLVSEARYIRNGNDLLDPGLYLDVPGYGHHIFRFDHSPLC